MAAFSRLLPACPAPPSPGLPLSLPPCLGLWLCLSVLSLSRYRSLPLCFSLSLSLYYCFSFSLHHSPFPEDLPKCPPCSLASSSSLLPAPTHCPPPPPATAPPFPIPGPARHTGEQPSLCGHSAPSGRPLSETRGWENQAETIKSWRRPAPQVKGLSPLTLRLESQGRPAAVPAGEGARGPGHSRGAHCVAGWLGMSLQAAGLVHVL